MSKSDLDKVLALARKIDVGAYDRTEHGRLEHVSSYSRILKMLGLGGSDKSSPTGPRMPNPESMSEWLNDRSGRVAYPSSLPDTSAGRDMVRRVAQGNVSPQEALDGVHLLMKNGHPLSEAVSMIVELLSPDARKRLLAEMAPPNSKEDRSLSEHMKEGITDPLRAHLMGWDQSERST